MDTPTNIRIKNGIFAALVGIALSGITIQTAKAEPVWDVIHHESYDLGYQEGLNYAKSEKVQTLGLTSADYVVLEGDTVFEIMRKTGAYWKDIIKINNIQSPYSLTVGSVLKLGILDIPNTDVYVSSDTLPDYKLVVDEWWSYKVKLRTISKKQKSAFKKIMNVENYDDQSFLRKIGYVETVYNQHGNGRPHQSKPRGLFQFKKSTAKMYGLYKKGKDYRGNVSMNIKSTIDLKNDTDKLLESIGAPVNTLWRYLAHQQGEYGVRTLWKVYSGEQDHLTFTVAWDDNTSSIRKALRGNLTRSLSKDKTIKALPDSELAQYFVNHWKHVFVKANEASAYMLTQI